MFTVLTEAFQKSGLTQAQVARRLNMDRALVSRYLGTPANWEFETLCDLFFAICGAVLNPELSFPAGEKQPMDEEKELEGVSRATAPLPDQGSRPPKTLLGPDRDHDDNLIKQMQRAA
jgi:transcriptional regulator with XRE-family HTH domain